MKRNSKYKRFLSSLELGFGNAISSDKLVSGNKYNHEFAPYSRGED